MRARAVIGANYGDEGKGLMTDYLCANGAGVVVRYNGGAQAGHTVVTPDGLRHVFQHFGSGTFVGVPTFLSQFFVCNPIAFARELVDYQKTGGPEPEVYAHPDCLVTTFVDMMLNQQLEDARGDARHGSVGLGFNETIERSSVDELKITLADLWNRSPTVKDRLVAACTTWAQFRGGKSVENADKMIEAQLWHFEQFAERVHPAGIGQCKDIVFEGAQGLLLCQDSGNFPHVTRSYTGMRNIAVLCAQAGIDKLDAYYVSRTYLTKHGAGPMPGHDPSLSFPDETNKPHRYQGCLRFAWLDDGLRERVAKDAAQFPGAESEIVFTHSDQCAAPTWAKNLVFGGPTREHADYTDSRAA